MKDKIKEILEKHECEVAKKHGLGSALVTGHKRSYFHEAFNNAIIEICEEQIEEALRGVCHSDIIIKPQNIAK